MFHDGHVLPGQVREAVYVKGMIFRKVALLQLFQQPVHLVTGILAALGADCVIASQDQGQFFQLLGQGSGGLPCRGGQLRRGDAASFEFVHRVQKAGEKLRLGLHVSVGFQFAGQSPHGGSHGDEPSAVVQTLRDPLLLLFCHPAQEPGKRQNFCVHAGSVPGCRTEPALCVMADQFRHQQDHAPLLFPDIGRNAFQHPVPARDPVCGKDQIQHISHLFFFRSFCLLYHRSAFFGRAVEKILDPAQLVQQPEPDLIFPGDCII